MPGADAGRTRHPRTPTRHSCAGRNPPSPFAPAKGDACERSKHAGVCPRRRCDGSTMTRTLLTRYTALSFIILLVLACGGAEEALPTFDPDPPITESEAIEIAKASLAEVVEDIEFAGYDQIRIRVGTMRLRKLQELTQSDLYTPDSPRMQRQIWAVQVGGTFENDPNPYRVPFGYGIVGVDAINGDIWLRARYDDEVLVDP